eukprot:scaffold3.g6437.t1
MGDNPFAAAGNPFAAGAGTTAFGAASAVETSYTPPATGAWQRPQAGQPEEEEGIDEEPFTAAHLAAANQAAVPAVAPAGAQLPQHTTLTFTESTQPPPAALTGRIGQPVANGGGGPPSPPAPRVGSATDAALLGGGRQASGGSLPPAPGGETEDPSKYAFYNIKRYRTHFNVDTREVLHRIFCSVVLFFRGDFLDRIAPNPDLYGPFWVATTLIFVSAATGNYASYIHYQREHEGSGDEGVKGWYYDVDKVGGSFGLFYGYVGVVGLACYFALRWFKAGVPLAAVWCTYGYALAIYIPVSFVCVFPVKSMRWAVLGAATGVSALFILLTFRRPVHDSEAGAKALPLLLVMLGLHLGLGLALKLYFFRYAAID